MCLKVIVALPINLLIVPRYFNFLIFYLTICDCINIHWLSVQEFGRG